MYKAIVVALILVFVPVASSAQTAEELQAKINALLAQIKVLQDQISGAPAAATTATSASLAAAGCPNLTRTLGVGSRGADVTTLQVFLKAQGHMSDEATGYFGLITEAAVKKLQVAHNLVSSGSAQTTGYGSVGPKTRALIASLCSAVSASVSTQTQTMQCAQATSPTAPAIACGGRWEKLMNNTCHIGWRCVLATTSGNKPPVITAIEGPTSLGIDVFSSWKINAIDPEGSALTYSVTWGDEGVEDILKAIAGLTSNFTTASSVTHSYAKAGNYSMQVTVKDSAGATAVGALGIKVTAGASGVVDTSYYNPLSSLASTTSASACTTPWGSHVVPSGQSVLWQPFFTDGAYFATSSPIMKCENSLWKKCGTDGLNCQSYTHPTSTPSTAALPSYPNTIGQTCSPEGSAKEVSVPPGTQLCQWLNCRITTTVETIKLKCTHSGWTDYANY